MNVVNIHDSLSGGVSGIDIGNESSIKVNNCNVNNIDILNIDKGGELYSSGGLNLSVSTAYFNE
ncbi:MAG: hypothetical protein IJU02_08775 [Lachnospiraceae bacterium]|nr:hypothetical protein [Lachnospiraceae bacterium]